MDFQGQKLAETLAMLIVTAFAAIGFIYGYARQDFRAMMSVFGGGVILAAVVSVPDWPVYNKHPVKFLPPKADEQPRGGGAGGSGGRRPSKKKTASWANLWGFI